MGTRDVSWQLFKLGQMAPTSSISGKCFLRFGQSYDRCGRINQLSKKREREDDTAISYLHLQYYFTPINSKQTTEYNSNHLL